MSKRTRQQAVIDIVSSKRVLSQAALAEELKKLNFDVTQATLSRDIAELNLVKSKDGYLRPEDAGGSAQPANPDPVAALKRLVIKVDAAQNLVVVRTPRSSAQQVGLAFDDPMFSQIIGNVAGDDTVVVVTGSPDAALEVKKLIMDIIN